MVDHTAEPAGVFVHDGTEAGLVGGTGALVQADEESIDAVFSFAVFLGRTHEHGAECRADHEGADARDTHGCSQRDTELGVEHTTRATHHGDGNEHGHEDEGTGDDGHGDVAHGVFGSLIGRGVACVELRLHGLHDNDGIIYYRTDSQHQSEECQ